MCTPLYEQAIGSSDTASGWVLAARARLRVVDADALQSHNESAKALLRLALGFAWDPQTSWSVLCECVSHQDNRRHQKHKVHLVPVLRLQVKTMERMELGKYEMETWSFFPEKAR